MTAREGQAGWRSARGRPSAEDVVARRRAVLEATAALLAEGGHRAATTTAVAARAGVSKESLYSWFGDKTGLLAALVQANAEGLNARLGSGLVLGEDPARVLGQFAADLLGLLTGPGSVAVNRAALAELPDRPETAKVLLQHGRLATGALVEQYLADCDARGLLPVPDPPAAFRLLYGLLVQDLQIRVLLGDQPPDPAEIGARSEVAVRRFLVLLDAEAPGLPQTGGGSDRQGAG